MQPGNQVKRAPDGRYITYVADETRPNGRRQVRKKSKTDLYRYLLGFYNISEAENANQCKSFQDLYTEWVEYKRKFVSAKNRKKSLSPSTIRRYERDYENHLLETELNSQPIGEISPVYLENALMAMIEKDSLTESSAGNILGYVRQAFAYAKRSGYINEDPGEHIDRQMILAMSTFSDPKPDEERVLTLNELQMLEEAVTAHEKSHPEYMPDYAVELAILTGMRVGELAALKWECIDDDFVHIDYSEHRLDFKDKKCELIIDEPKNGKHRKIPMTDDIMDLFGRIKAVSRTDCKEGFIFVRKDGSRYTGHTISCAVVRRAEEAGIGGTSIHEIRRTVSSMLRTILPVKTVANLLGHLEQTNEEHYNYDMMEMSEKKRALSEVSSKVIKSRSGLAR